MSANNQPFPHWQRQLLEHVARYRMTTLRAAAASAFRSTTPIPIARQRLSDLVGAGLLGEAPIYRKQRYYYLMSRGVDLLTETGADQASSSESRPAYGPLSEQAKIRAYAMLAFCCLSGEKGGRLTRDQFEREMPNLYRPGMPMSYYVARRSDQTVLGFLRVDSGGHGRWDRVVRKVRQDIESHWQHSGFRALIQNETFEIAVVTAMPVKCERIRRALADAKKLRPVPLRIVAVPKLIHLLSPPATRPAVRAQQ